jgi:hypothetical protein
VCAEEEDWIVNEGCKDVLASGRDQERLGGGEEERRMDSEDEERRFETAREKEIEEGERGSVCEVAKKQKEEGRAEKGRGEAQKLEVWR